LSMPIVNPETYGGLSHTSQDWHRSVVSSAGD